mgnify:CR=1 FL=1
MLGVCWKAPAPGRLLPRGMVVRCSHPHRNLRAVRWGAALAAAWIELVWRWRWGWSAGGFIPAAGWLARFDVYRAFDGV